jgi:hypothetical protein
MAYPVKIPELDLSRDNQDVVALLSDRLVQFRYALVLWALVLLAASAFLVVAVDGRFVILGSPLAKLVLLTFAAGTAAWALMVVLQLSVHIFRIRRAIEINRRVVISLFAEAESHA